MLMCAQTRGGHTDCRCDTAETGRMFGSSVHFHAPIYSTENRLPPLSPRVWLPFEKCVRERQENAAPNELITLFRRAMIKWFCVYYFHGDTHTHGNVALRSRWPHIKSFVDFIWSYRRRRRRGRRRRRRRGILVIFAVSIFFCGHGMCCMSRFCSGLLWAGPNKQFTIDINAFDICRSLFDTDKHTHTHAQIACVWFAQIAKHLALNDCDRWIGYVCECASISRYVSRFILLFFFHLFAICEVHCIWARAIWDVITKFVRHLWLRTASCDIADFESQGDVSVTCNHSHLLHILRFRLIFFILFNYLVFLCVGVHLIWHLIRAYQNGRMGNVESEKIQPNIVFVWYSRNGTVRLLYFALDSMANERAAKTWETCSLIIDGGFGSICRAETNTTKLEARTRSTTHSSSIAPTSHSTSAPCYADGFDGNSL